MRGTWSALACSGLIYSGVPRPTPVSVNRCALAEWSANAIPKVRDQRLAILQQNVFGLDVPMDHVMAVRVIQRARHGLGDLDGHVDPQLLLAIEFVAQRLPFQ